MVTFFIRTVLSSGWKEKIAVQFVGKIIDQIYYLEELDAIAIADFDNVQGLAAVGDTAWVETNESGEPVIAAPGSGSLGLITSGALEDSNVDLSEQLVQLIIAQRNFQANARTISTSDEITQTIINI